MPATCPATGEGLQDAPTVRPRRRVDLVGMGEREDLLAAYDADDRRWTPPTPPPGVRYEHLGPILRVVGRQRGFIDPAPDLGLAGDALDGLIREQRDFFAARGEAVEWKTRGHDRPAEVPERLVATGFVPGSGDGHDRSGEAAGDRFCAPAGRRHPPGDRTPVFRGWPRSSPEVWSSTSPRWRGELHAEAQANPAGCRSSWPSSRPTSFRPRAHPQARHRVRGVGGRASLLGRLGRGVYRAWPLARAPGRELGV